MRKDSQKEQAVEMRKQLCSVNEIAKKLGVSKGSVSAWVRGVELDSVSRKFIISRGRSRSRNPERGKIVRARFERVREESRRLGRKRAETDSEFRVVCALFWGEGRKSANMFSISNCDPALMRVVWDWLVSEGFSARVKTSVSYYSENQVSVEHIVDYWKRHLPGLHEIKTRVSKISRASQSKGVGKQSYGTAEIQVCSTELVQKIYGGIEYLGRATSSVSSLGRK